MNESSNERPKQILPNAEDLGWKKGFRWPKSFSYEAVEYQDFGPEQGCDCFDLNEHIYRSREEVKVLINDGFRDGRERIQVDPMHLPENRERR